MALLVQRVSTWSWGRSHPDLDRQPWGREQRNILSKEQSMRTSREVTRHKALPAAPRGAWRTPTELTRCAWPRVGEGERRMGLWILLSTWSLKGHRGMGVLEQKEWKMQNNKLFQYLSSVVYARAHTHTHGDFFLQAFWITRVPHHSMKLCWGLGLFPPSFCYNTKPPSIIWSWCHNDVTILPAVRLNISIYREENSVSLLWLRSLADCESDFIPMQT